MRRQPPAVLSDEIDLYVRTYYSLLRSTGEVRVRAFEEAHSFSRSSLHEGALEATPDLSAFAYAAARLPEVMVDVDLVVLGQSHELFEAAGFDVQGWQIVRTRGRRRPLRFDAKSTLAVFTASESDIDDLVPIVTAYQIEWNKMHRRARAASVDADGPLPSRAELASIMGVEEAEIDKLVEALGSGRFERGARAIARRELDLRVRMLSPSYSQYKRAAQRWWSGVDPVYQRATPPRRPPVYFVSSNTHAIANLVGGYARANSEALVAFTRGENPEGLADEVTRAAASGDDAELSSLLYYLLRAYIHASPGGGRMKAVRAFEAAGGLVHLSEPGHIDVDAQIVELAKLDVDRLDPRLRFPGVERLKRSEAYILNIDYPLGMAAYHVLSRVGIGVGELRGVYVMGKAATLNGRVGDVMLSGVVYDEHSRNTYVFRNCFQAKDVRPHLRFGSVFDNQSALTVRSAFLQNKQYMTTFYRDGYTVLEMEAGPFCSALYELLNPQRVPEGEIVHLDSADDFDLGILHYASDTPYSRRQSLLSKSLSYFGVDSTYACAIAIVRRILQQEAARLG
jgi:hypothetical protein